MKGVLLSLLAVIAGGCSCIDDFDPWPSCEPVESKRDIRVKGDVATITDRTTDSCGHVDEDTRVWLRQKDGEYKYAGSYSVTR